MVMTEEPMSTEAIDVLKAIFIKAVCDILDCKHYTGSKVEDQPDMVLVHYFISNKRGDRNIWRVEDKDLGRRLERIAKPLVERF